MKKLILIFILIYRFAFKLNNFQNLLYKIHYPKKEIKYFILISFNLLFFSCASDNIEELNQDQISLNKLKITVVRNSQDYNSIRNTIESIKDASEAKQYTVYVPNGTWKETDIQGKKYIKIVGESRDNVILTCDPLGSMANLISPSDYFYSDQANKKLSEIPQFQRHLINLSDDLEIENITISAVNCKYPVHLDDKRYKKASFSNCKIIEKNCNRVIGIGVHNGQNLNFENCSFESIDPVETQEGIFIHNWNNMNEGNFVNINKCDFLNCSYLIIDELGSDQNDIINLTNCKTNKEEKISLMVDMDFDGKTYWTNPVTKEKEPNPTKIPYSFTLNVKGTSIQEIFSHQCGNFNLLWIWIPQRDLNTFKQKVFGL